MNSYVAIDLKSFYASVECVERGLDPMKTNLVVADKSRTEKTICLAVTPALKAYGIPGRPRLFEVVQRVAEVNAERTDANGGLANKSSFDADEISENPSVMVDYIIAPPRMALYIDYSKKIYDIYLKYVSHDDIHVYSIDEVFIDVTHYLGTYACSAVELARRMIKEVFRETGITATAGVGSNLYLCKVAMDIMAKRAPADKDGVRIAELDEISYRKQLWSHRPITDFWRVGKGYAHRLESMGLFTMGDICRRSLTDEDSLYSEFGINAELLIDHAWGFEPCTIADIKAFNPMAKSLSLGQVLQKPYDFEKGKLIVREMSDLLALELVEKGVVTNRMELTVGYDTECMQDSFLRKKYRADIVADNYGRLMPKPAHGTISLEKYTSSSKIIVSAVMDLYDKIVKKDLTVRRMYVVANDIVGEKKGKTLSGTEQLNMFTDYSDRDEALKSEEKEKSVQEAVISIHKKFGKNALVKGMNMTEGATAMERNDTIGGHKK